MSFSKRIIYLQRLCRSGLRLRRALFRRKKTIVVEYQIAIRQADIGQRVTRIAIDRLLEVLNSLLHPVFGTPFPKKASPQKCSIGLCIFGVALAQLLLLFAGQLQAQLVRDLSRNFLLHRKDVR